VVRVVRVALQAPALTLLPLPTKSALLLAVPPQSARLPLSKPALLLAVRLSHVPLPKPL